MNVIFWISTLVTGMVIVAPKLLGKVPLTVSNVQIAAVNHALLLLLPIVVITHGYDVVGIAIAPKLQSALSAIEQAVFPLYVGVLFAHIRANKGFFTKL